MKANPLRYAQVSDVISKESNSAEQFLARRASNQIRASQRKFVHELERVQWKSKNEQ